LKNELRTVQDRLERTEAEHTKAKTRLASFDESALRDRIAHLELDLSTALVKNENLEAKLGAAQVNGKEASTKYKGTKERL
jgi:hypothetical protein